MMNTNRLPKLTRLLNITHISLNMARIYGPATSELIINVGFKRSKFNPLFSDHKYFTLKFDMHGSNVIHAISIYNNRIQEDLWDIVRADLSTLEMHLYLTAIGKRMLRYLKDMKVLRYKGCLISDVVWLEM